MYDEQCCGEHIAVAKDVLEAVQVICTKVRDGDKRIVRLKEGSPKGRHVVIVDDLVQSGGTLIECQRLLKTQVRACWVTLDSLSKQSTHHIACCIDIGAPKAYMLCQALGMVVWNCAVGCGGCQCIRDTWSVP